MALLLGLDIGTTNLAAVAWESEGGRLLGRWSMPNRGRRDEAPGRAELDLDVIQAQVMELLGEVAAEVPYESVAGVGVTGQQHGVGFVDGSGRPIARAITWQDQRAAQEPLPSGETALQRYLRLGEGIEALERLGCRPATGYLGPTLLWLHEMDRLPAQADVRVCFVPDAAVAALIGKAPPCDPTDAGSSALYDIVAGGWDKALAARLGLPLTLLPPVVETGTRVGSLSVAAARATGLPAGTPVCVAMGDNQASYLGSVREPARTVLVNMGTGSQCSLMAEGFRRLPGVDTRAYPGGRYLFVGAGLFGGRSLGYLQTLFHRVGQAFWGQPSPPSLDAMVELAQRTPHGADGLQCNPTFTGTRLDPDARGAFVGLTPDNLTPGHLTRALLEGMAGAFSALYQDLVPELGPREVLVGAGNGIRRNPLLQELLSGAFGLPLAVPAWDEEAAVGAAMAAAVGVGALPDWDAAAAVVRYE